LPRLQTMLRTCAARICAHLRIPSRACRILISNCRVLITEQSCPTAKGTQNTCAMLLQHRHAFARVGAMLPVRQRFTYARRGLKIFC
jgi:hypothetical protein